MPRTGKIAGPDCRRAFPTAVVRAIDVLKSALEEDPFEKAAKNPPPAEPTPGAGEQKPPEPQAHA